ncbi:hypothetical protein C8Q80DRAFT_1152193 [Daedaleopsis nitida]|nr:hypothetical protein C8Q80DRAFT_1152193 [Daedaleopsis nitida]
MHNELTDRVIDYLHDDPNALSACGLVSSSWLATVRFHRFTKVHLRWSQIVPFHMLLTVSPALAPYVVHLSMTNNARKEAAICGILRSLTRLHTLSLSHFIFAPQELHSVVASLPPSLAHIELNQVDIPTVGDLIRIWTALPRLCSFTVVAVLWIRAPDIPDSYSQPLVPADPIVSLSELHLRWWMRHGDVLGRWLVAQHIPAQLRACSLYVVGTDMSLNARAIMSALGPCLETLELFALPPSVEAAGPSPGPEFKPFGECTLSRCTNLRELRLYASLERVKEWAPLDDRSMQWMPSFLARVQTPSIRCVFFSIEGAPGGSLYHGLPYLRDIAVLLSRDVFSELQEVVVQLYDHTQEAVHEEVFASIRKHLKRFDDRGLLTIKTVRSKKT